MIQNVTIIGLGLLGGSIGLAIRERTPDLHTRGFDLDPDVRVKAQERGLVTKVCETAEEALADTDLVILCVPVGAMKAAAQSLAHAIPADAIVSDVGSSKESVLAGLQTILPSHTIIPAHPVAGTEQSGPEAGFASLFSNRWCILTPPDGADPEAVEALSLFWKKLGAKIEIMDAAHHDLVLAVTSHIPHLIARLHAHRRVRPHHVARRILGKQGCGAGNAGPLYRGFDRAPAGDPIWRWRDFI